MIDARQARGVPCITTLPITIPDFLIPEGEHIPEWLLTAYGFTITTETPPHKPPTTR